METNHADYSKETCRNESAYPSTVNKAEMLKRYREMFPNHPWFTAETMSERAA